MCNLKSTQPTVEEPTNLVLEVSTSSSSSASASISTSASTSTGIRNTAISNGIIADIASTIIASANAIVAGVGSLVVHLALVL